MASRWWASWRIVGGVAISAACLYVVLQVVNLGQTSEILARANWSFAILALAATWADIAVRTVRWQVLLAPLQDVALSRVLAYMLVGYLANNVLPARAGELVRSHYVGDRENVSRASVVGTIVIERLLDVVGLVAISSLAWWLTGASTALTPLLLTGAIASAVGVGLVLGLPLLSRTSVIRRMTARGHLGARRIGTRLLEGVRVAVQPRVAVVAVPLTMLAWLATAVAFFAAAAMVDVSLSPPAILLLAAGVNLATAIPSAPGYIGTFEFAGVVIGGTLGLAPESAFAVALIVHVTVLTSTMVGGLVATYVIGVRRQPASTNAATGD